MKPVQLPNGFVLDIDSVHYIQSEEILYHPYTKKPTGDVRLILKCEGGTIVIMEVTARHVIGIKSIILKNLDERAKQ